MTEIVPVSPERLSDLAELFESNNATKDCWCKAFVVSRSEYYRGRHGGNRAYFEEMTATADPPLGLLAYRDERPVA